LINLRNEFWNILHFEQWYLPVSQTSLRQITVLFYLDSSTFSDNWKEIARTAVIFTYIHALVCGVYGETYDKYCKRQEVWVLIVSHVTVKLSEKVVGMSNKVD
jgi:hypothetical protein